MEILWSGNCSTSRVLLTMSYQRSPTSEVLLTRSSQWSPTNEVLTGEVFRKLVPASASFRSLRMAPIVPILLIVPIVQLFNCSNIPSVPSGSTSVSRTYEFSSNKILIKFLSFENHSVKTFIRDEFLERESAIAVYSKRCQSHSVRLPQLLGSSLRAMVFYSACS